MFRDAPSSSMRHFLAAALVVAALFPVGAHLPQGDIASSFGGGDVAISVLPSRLALRGGGFARSKEAEEAWKETMEMRAKYDEEERNIDEDLRCATDRIIEEIDARAARRDKEQRDELERNGPRWVPPINRHFMDPCNYTSDFGPMYHPPYPVVPTLAMMDPSTRLRESACRGRTYEVREIIANEGGQVNKTDDDGFYAAIHWASLMGHADTVEALVELGADVNARTRHRRNALHYACEEGRDQVVKVLLASGTNSFARDVNGKMPVDLATRFGHNVCADLVRHFMDSHPNTDVEGEEIVEEVVPVDVIQANDSDEPYFSEQSLESEDLDEEERLALLAKMGGGKDFGGLWGRER